MDQKERCACPCRPRSQTVVFALVVAVGMTVMYVHLTGHLVVYQRVFKHVQISMKPTSSSRHFGCSLAVQQDSRDESGKTTIYEQDFSIQSSTNQGCLFRDTRPGNRMNVSGPSVNSTARVLMDAIPREIEQTVGKKKRRGRSFHRKTYYRWNDGNRTSHAKLPLRGKNDRKWKKEEALVFNRVPKCASRTVILLLRKLADVNNFHLLSSLRYVATVDEKLQRYIVKTLDQVKTPYLFEKHLYFIDFTKFNARQPRYINIIRDPLSRFVSNYYFSRFGDTRLNLHYNMSKKMMYRSITECILQSYPECVKGGASIIVPYFCGQQQACRQPSQWALERAKQNVEKHFVVVGILEDLENSFRVFEKVLPRYFTGMVELFNDPAQNLKNSSFVTKNKEKPSPEAAAVMKRVMHYEYDFYDFVKDRLDRQKAQCGIT